MSEFAMRLEAVRSLDDVQRFHRELDDAKGFDPDLYRNVVYLMSEVGELADILKNYRASAEPLAPAERAGFASELADCLAYLAKLANYAGVDLAAAYAQKMRANLDREWPR